jgi:gamma-tubulin complex component 2
MASSSAKPEPDPALKAKLASLVSRLTAELGVGGGRSAEGLATASVAMLSKMISPYDVTKVSVQQSQKALAASAPDPEAFAAHYARLKAMRVREVDKYLAVVAKIAGDPDLLAAVTAPRVSASDAAAAASPSAYAASEHAAVSEVTSADVSSLPVDGFSFQTNPLASEAASPGPRAADPSAPRGTSRRIGDDFDLGDLNDASDGAFAVAETRARVRALDIGGARRDSDVSELSGLAAADDDDDAPRRRLAEGVDFPRLPEWTRRRPYLTGAHLGATRAFVTPGKPLREYSAACQELLVVDDLLYAALGVDGRFVAARRAENGDEISFEIEPGLEGSLHALAREALPLCASAAAAAAFCEAASGSFEGGLVRHALAAEMEEMLHDWRVMVVQLEHQRNAGRLSLQSLWFYARPAAGALATLAATARKVRAGNLRGAGLLNALHADAAARAGDPSARALTLRLLGAASKPYVRAVERWVYEGVVDDPYDEFLVLEQRGLRKESLADEYNAKYWDRRYSLRPETPQFLNGALARKALTTGKYIDAARESWNPRTSRRARDERARAAETGATRGDLRALRAGERRETFADDRADFALPPRPEDGLGRVALDAFATGRDGGEMAGRIERAFEHASAELLGAVLDDGDLRARLRSLKKYFLTHQGDFLVHFVDIAGAELARPALDVSVERLQSMLELSLKVEGSTAASDPHADQMTCALERRGIIAQLLAIQGAAGDDGFAPRARDETANHPRTDAESLGQESSVLTGMDTFTLEYRAPWPTSLVLSRKALTKYQLLFRHVFHCKHVERRLCAAWRARKATRGGGVGGGVRGSGGALGGAHVVLQRMLHFTQNFVHYLTMEVIDPNWAALEKKLDAAATVDELIAAHDAFLDACLKEGMLFWPTTLRRLDVIAKTCVAFADAVASVGDDEEDTGVSVAKYAVAGEDADVARKLESLESSFDECVKELFLALNRSAHTEPNLSSLCARLDFNEYYTYGPGGKY